LDICGSTVATGEVGSKPMILLWDTNKKEDGLLHSTFMISKELTNSVANLCMTPSQKFLAATCNDEDHKLVIYNLV
jgi:protein-arginine kinase